MILLSGCATDVAEQQTRVAAQEVAPESDNSLVDGEHAAQVASGAGEACPAGSSRAPAAGLRIREIALYQAVKIPLVSNGAWVAQRPVTVVQNKRALVRVFVDPVSGYQPHALRGALTLQNGGTSTELVSTRTLTAASTDAKEDSTFTFDVPADKIGASTQLSVALTETACGAASAAATTATRFPASGAQALGATNVGVLKVVLVPITIAGRATPISQTDLQGVRDALLSYYPVPTVDVSIRSRPLVVSTGLTAQDSRAWSNMVNAVIRERGTDRPSSDTYYFGLMQPTATFATYCARGCIAGMAPQLTRVSASSQVGIGIFYPAGSVAAFTQAAEIIVHELGHAHGRGHAPCVTAGGNISGVDRSYPTAGGLTGVWGWNSRTNTLNDPAVYKDVMGYCRPNWISAYTYQALAVRSQSVNTKRAAFELPGSVRWQNVIAYADGSNRWGGVAQTELPGGELEPARVLDATGNVIDEIEVARTELSHTDDQLIYLPEPGKDWAKVSLRDREIVLSDVAAPL